MKHPKRVAAVTIVAAVLVAVVVAVILNINDADQSRQKAIDLVKESLEKPDSQYGPDAFEAWEATGDNNMMDVSATYYPHSVEGDEQGHKDVLHEMKWQVNLRTGVVVCYGTVEPDG